MNLVTLRQSDNIDDANNMSYRDGNFNLHGVEMIKNMAGI